MGIYDRKEKESDEKDPNRKYWLHLLPAAAVVTVLAASVIFAEKPDQTVSSASVQNVNEKDLKKFFSSDITQEDDQGQNEKDEKTSSLKSSRTKSGKIKTSSSKRTVPASASSAGRGSSGGMGSTQTPVMQIPESGYQDGTYEGSGTGFGGTIRVSVTISGGKIASISILEAAGETASYFASATGVISRVIAQQSPNVDAVSGATYSSNGIIQAIQNAVAKAAASGQGEMVLPTVAPVPEETAAPTSAPKPTEKPDKEPEEKPEEEPDGYKDGTYTGTGTGFNGPVTLTVKIKNGVIRKISAEHQDTDIFFSKAWETLEPQILEKQSVAGIDTVSGATYSSIGILGAMEQVIRQAGYQSVTPAPTKVPKPTKAPQEQEAEATPVPSPGDGPDDPQPTPEIPVDGEVTPGGEITPGTEVTPAPDVSEDPGETPEPEPTPEPEGPYIDGTYSGTSWGYSGKVTVTVTISQGQIVSITQTNKDTAEFFDMAWQTIIPTAMSQQSADGIDTVSGATFSSLGILEGLQSALAQARR